MNKKCIYLAEGECEEKLIKALKEKPSLLLPGKVKRFNVIQDELKTNHLVTFSPGSLVILVFDTDNEVTDHLCEASRLHFNLNELWFALLSYYSVDKECAFANDLG